jgi:nitrile hydratase
MPGPHDLGGADFGAVKRNDHHRSDADKRVDAMQYTLRAHGYWCVDEMRRAIESIPRDDYLNITYYQKWLAALYILVKEKNLLSQEEIDTRLALLRAGVANN